MSFLIAILILLLLGAVVLVVGAPLRARGYGEETADDIASPGVTAQTPTTLSDEVARDEVESAREAKYREIRDAEMDFRTGKLSREDYEGIDAQLRAEALEILNRLEASEPPG